MSEVANIKSSQKKNRQRITHEARNQARKSAMRTAV
jgi:ribosomal protein S20